MLQKQGPYAIALICVVLGIMLAVQFRTTQSIQSSPKYQRVEDLTQRLIQTEKERNALMDQIRDLRQSTVGEAGVKEMEYIRLFAGLVPLQGAGVIITVDDTRSAGPAGGKNPNLFLIKDEDLLKILNELRAADAEAISINNQRLVATSEIRTAGPYISINNMSFAAPFEIKAIGDPTTLENALKLRGGVIETIQFWGIQVSVKQQPNVEIPAFKGAFRFNYAQPVQDGGN